MQEYKDIDIDSLISDGPDTINKNFKTLMSNNAGGEFPTDNLYAGMTCYRSDEGKIYTLKNDLSTWVELFDISSTSGAVAPLANALTKTLSIANGGTGANNASQACANLGAVRKVNNTAPDSNGNVNVGNVNVDTATNSEIDAALNLAEIGVLPENGAVPVSKGGTGATTIAGARTNLGVSATTDFASIAFTGSYEDLNDKPAFALINNTVLSGTTVVDNLEIKNTLNIPGGKIWIE